MGLIFWWLLIIWVLGFAGYGVWKYIEWRRAKSRPVKKQSKVPVAHSKRLTELPAYKAAFKQYHLILRVTFALLTVAVLLSVLLTARPASISLLTPSQQGRDIMLCLDVSGSVLRTDTTIVNKFGNLANTFQGQRIGLTLFNSSSIQVLPLNDDYQLTIKQLQKVATAFQKQKGQDFDNLTNGTLADFDKGTSLVGDGLTSCVNNLGQNPQKRFQSVILATDNEANGTPIIANDQAISLAQKRNVRIYAIDPGASDASRSNDHKQLQALTEKTGGKYFKLSDSNAISSIINNISDQEEKYTAGVQVVAVVDSPALFIWLLGVTGLAGMALMWRLRL